jgi:hypothetical protein
LQEAQTTSKTKLLSPNGGEQWIAGETRTIRWEGIPNTGAQNQVELLLFPWSERTQIASTSMTAMIATTTPNTGTYEWVIPSSIPAGDYFVRVFCITFQNCVGSAGDDSDESFRILKSGISITSPNGGETVKHKTPLVISWTSTNIGKGNVDIRFLGYIPGSDKIVGTTSVIAFNIPNSGSFTWMVSPDLPTSYRYFVSVSATKTGLFEDRSDKTFSIIEDAPQLTAYCAGVSRGKVIEWNATVSGGKAPYKHRWSGDDGLEGYSALVVKEYQDITIAKNATLEVTSQDGQTTKTTCASAFPSRAK